MPAQIDAIVPRWEWRTFGNDLSKLKARIGEAVGMSPSRRSVETYIVYLDGSQNAKIRNDQLDIKVLREVDSHGLELWEPVLKATFPISSEKVAAAIKIWGLSDKPATGRSFSEDQFIRGLIKPRNEFVVAEVENVREGFIYKGCIAEFVRLTSGLTKLESISFEHEEPAVVFRALQSLDLEGKHNVSYPSALKEALLLGAAE